MTVGNALCVPDAEFELTLWGAPASCLDLKVVLQRRLGMSNFAQTPHGQCA
jgi:hypothetical protein